MGRCPREAPRGPGVGLRWTQQGQRERAQRAQARGPPSQALWRLVSWEAESDPSSEQEGDIGSPGAPLRAPSRTGAFGPGGPKPPPQPKAEFREPVCLPQQVGDLPPSKPFAGYRREGSRQGEARLSRCATSRGGLWQWPPHRTSFQERQVSKFESGAVWVRLCIHVGLHQTCQGRWQRGW